MRGTGGAQPWDRDWGTVPDPLGYEALPLVGEVYGWLSWANQGTTRGMRKRPFDAVLLRRDGGNREVPPGGLGSPRGPREGPQVSDPGGVARQGANVAGLPGRGGGAPHHGCGRQQLAPPSLAQRPCPLALPPAQPATATAPAGRDGPQHAARDTRGGKGKRERHNTRYRPDPPQPAASAAHTRTGHCTRQGSSGALRHAPGPRLGSLRASPRGSHWRQASSTGPAAPAPRATTH